MSRNTPRHNNPFVVKHSGVTLIFLGYVDDYDLYVARTDTGFNLYVIGSCSRNCSCWELPDDIARADLFSNNPAEPHRGDHPHAGAVTVALGRAIERGIVPATAQDVPELQAERVRRREAVARLYADLGIDEGRG